MRHRRPHRTIHLIDIENLCGEPRPSGPQVVAVRSAYEAAIPVGAHDHVVLACNHGAALPVGANWPGRLLVKSGPNGADIALTEVVNHESVGERFDHVVVASGDGIFAEPVSRLISADVAVRVVSRPQSLSRRLLLAAGGSLVTLTFGHSPEGPGALARSEAA